MVSSVFLTFFAISLLTNILGPIVPDIVSSFHVNLTAAAFLAFAFFIAYGVMSIPAGPGNRAAPHRSRRVQPMLPACAYE